VIRILVVDDETQLLRALRINLSARRYEVVTAQDGAAALDAAAKHVPDLVVLDLGLPDMDGTDVIAGLRGWTRIPILVLSGRTDAADKVAALDSGADDYVTKPFSMDELLARIRALIRRVEADAAPAPATIVGRHVVDLAAKTVTPAPDAAGAAEPIRLTKTEWAMLEILLRNPGRLGVFEKWGRGRDACHARSLRCRVVPIQPSMGTTLRLAIARARRRALIRPHISNTPWSPAARSCWKSGAPPTRTRSTTCASTWAACARNSSPSPPAPANCSPNPVWATASSPDPAPARV